MKITLIGMPGAGKSYIGKRLAETLKLTCVETDRLLEQEYNKPLPQVLHDLGQEAFIRKEAEVIKDVVQEQKELVISPGGSVVYSPETMRLLQEASIIIYLYAPLETIRERVGNVPRGIVGLGERPLEELYKERTALYERWAAVTIDATQVPERVVEDIVAALHSQK